MAKPYAAGASESHVAVAARNALERGGSAVDAVLTAVLHAAAESPGVWLGPLQVLAAGGGAGLLAIDGRARQPGLAVPRPRGVVAGQEVPLAARVGVPGLPYALATLHGALGGASLLSVASSAVAHARAVSPERAAVLDLFARRGTAAMQEEAVVGELVAAAGRAAGGSLTREDLGAVRPAVVAQAEGALEGGVLTAPWKPAAPPLDATSTHVVVAADARGLVVAACYESPPYGLPVPALGLVAQLAAAPVRRGEPRVRPGDPRPAPAPIALRARRGIADLGVGVAWAADAEAQLGGLLDALDTSATFAESLGAVTSGRVVALARGSGDLPVVLRSA